MASAKGKKGICRTNFSNINHPHKESPLRANLNKKPHNPWDSEKYLPSTPFYCHTKKTPKDSQHNKGK